MPFLTNGPSRLLGNRGFNPLSLSPLLWLKADAISALNDADAITTWADSSGNGRNGAGTNATYKTNIANGKPVARLAAGYFTIATSTALFNALHYTGGTVLAVASFGVVADPNAIYGLLGNNGGTASNVGYALYWDDRASQSMNNGLRGTIFAGGNVTVSSNVQSALVTQQAFAVVSSVTDPQNATASLRSTMRVNGGTAIQNNSATGTATANNARFDLQIGAAGNNTAAAYADIAEIIVYGTKLADADRMAAERYLGVKWGVAVA